MAGSLINGLSPQQAEPRKANRVAQRQRHLRPRWWYAIAVLCLFLMNVAWWHWQQTPHGPAPSQQTVTDATDEQYYFADSAYDGIRSKFVIRHSRRETTSIEYPVTRYPTINRIIHQAIDQDDQRFRQAVAAGTQFTEPMQQTVSYQVSLNTDRYLSITILNKHTTHGAHPVELTHFWTFDIQAGRALTLRDLTANNPATLEHLVAVIRQQAAARLQQRSPTIDLAEYITASSLQHFVVVDRATLLLPYGQAAILPASYGTLDITVPMPELDASLRARLQTPVATALFDIPPPPAPSPPTAPVQPSVPPTPSAGCAVSKCVALTFDDGPSQQTPRLLDMLDQYSAKATFYVIGHKLYSFRATVQQTVARGHQLGNHTWTHPDLTRLPTAQVEQQLRQTNHAIEHITGRQPTTIRPPYGATNSTVNALAHRLGLITTLWTVDTRDWADRNSTIVCHRALAGARPGAIILLHDIHATSVDAVPCILSGLHQQGYRAVTIDTLVGRTAPRPTGT